MANYKLPCDEPACCPPHPHPEPHANPVTILNCGTGSGISLPVESNVFNGVSYGIIPQVVGAVNIDTRGLHDITKKIDFSGMINFKAENFFSFTVVFQLFVVCNNGSKQALPPTWTYEKQVELEYDAVQQANGPFDLDFEFKEPFCFTWCECDECPECCRFTIEVVDVRPCNVKSASLTNVSISAMAVGMPNYR